MPLITTQLEMKLATEFDAVVMLTWSDWKNESRSNRYHYASRFARMLPVLFLHHNRQLFPSTDKTKRFEFISNTGISRWKCEEKLKITGFTILNCNGETSKVYALEPAKLALTVTAEHDDDFSYRCGVVFLDAEGNTALKLISPVYNAKLKQDESQHSELLFNSLQLGPGAYVVSLSLHFGGALELFNTTLKYDHIGRSFDISVLMPEAQLPFSAKFFHSAEWTSTKI